MSEMSLQTGTSAFLSGDRRPRSTAVGSSTAGLGITPLVHSFILFLNIVLVMKDIFRAFISTSLLGLASVNLAACQSSDSNGSCSHSLIREPLSRELSIWAPGLFTIVSVLSNR